MDERVSRPGAVVRLKSGGPQMTVENRSAYVAWRDGQQTHRETFPPDAPPQRVTVNSTAPTTALLPGVAVHSPPHVGGVGTALRSE